MKLIIILFKFLGAKGIEILDLIHSLVHFIGVIVLGCTFLVVIFLTAVCTILLIDDFKTKYLGKKKIKVGGNSSVFSIHSPSKPNKIVPHPDGCIHDYEYFRRYSIDIDGIGGEYYTCKDCGDMRKDLN